MREGSRAEREGGREREKADSKTKKVENISKE